jgi:hypothetical protein
MGHSQGKPYVWRRALVRMTDAPETTWRSSCQPQQACSIPGFHNNKMDNRRQNSIKFPLQSFSGHVSDHCRVVRSIQSQVNCGLMHSVDTGFHNNKMDNRRQSSIKFPLQSFSGHISDHCRVVRSIQSQVYCGRMHSVETVSLILSTYRNV